MAQKAKVGGTPGRAPVGYLNVRRKLEDGREIRTIEIDPERAGHVQWAFETFAKGEDTITTLMEKLGLSDRRAPQRAIADVFDAEVVLAPTLRGCSFDALRFGSSDAEGVCADAAGALLPWVAKADATLPRFGSPDRVLEFRRSAARDDFIGTVVEAANIGLSTTRDEVEARVADAMERSIRRGSRRPFDWIEAGVTTLGGLTSISATATGKPVPAIAGVSVAMAAKLAAMLSRRRAKPRWTEYFL